MEEVLRIMIENLVDEKKSVFIKTREEDGKEIYTIRVAEEEMGKIIGRQGKIAKAIKVIAKALAAKEGKRIEIEFP